jgi:hypothetical protein
LPNALLFGCDIEFARPLATDPRWTIAFASHCEEGKGTYPLPSPVSWNLIVDDCLHTGFQHLRGFGRSAEFTSNNEVLEIDAQGLGLPYYRVPASYLREARNAHGIRFCTSQDDLHHVTTRRRSEDRHIPVEFNAVDARATHISDVVHDFERFFCQGYLYSHIWSRAARPIFRDFYEEPTVLIWKGDEPPEWLYLLDIPDKARRIDALARLCSRSAPKLWPDLYAGSFQSRRVRELRERQSHLAAEYRMEVERIDDEVAAEETFLAPFYNLLYVGDEALADLVGKALRDIVHCGTENLDEQVTKDDWRTLDLRVTYEKWTAFAEVRGSTNRNARINDLEQFDDHYETDSKRYGAAASKILVFNGKYGRPEDERLRDATFSRQVISEAETRGVTLIDTRDLLDAIDRIRSGDLTVGQFMEALARPGRLTLPVAVSPPELASS